MPGFIGCNIKNGFVLPIGYKSDLIIKTQCESDFFIQARTIRKFENDKIFYNDDGFFILTEGVILNSKLLQEKYLVDSLVSLCIEMYKRNGETFFNEFRGSFSGVLFDKKNDILLIFTDHIGDKAVFYSEVLNNNFLFGSEIFFILELFKANDITWHLDMSGAYSMLTYSFMLADFTYIKEIRRLNAGHYVRIYKNKLSVIKYHKFEYKPDYTLSENEIIEKIDSLFTKAVIRQLGKNEEYGYKNLAALSAGLDTRMVNFAINKILDKPITNFTYSPIGFPDEFISKQIARKLKNRYIYQSNDNGDALEIIDEAILVNEGLMTYYGSAVLVDFFKNIELKDYGIIHTGQIGDAIIGTYNAKTKNITSTLNAYSVKLIHKFNNYFDFEEYKDKFADSEIYSHYNKAFFGVNSGSLLVFQQKTESTSPFMDVDFFEFCLTIPFEKRVKSYIYDKWILAKYPEAAKYSHNGQRYIGKGLFDRLKLKHYLIKTAKLSLEKIGINIERGITSNTPIDYWYNTNTHVKKTLDDYFLNNISRLEQFPELQNDCETLYTTGTGMEKNQVLTLLGIMKRYFDKR